MNLFYEDYPVTIHVDGREIPIVTDFREYVKLMDMLKSEELTPFEKRYLLAGYFKEPPEDFEKALEALSDFVMMEILRYPESLDSENEELDSEESMESMRDVYSFEIDYPFIFSGFLNVYGINIRTISYMHWWEFRMLFNGLPDDTEIKQRIKYRSMDLSKIKDKDERRRIEKIQLSIRLPDSKLSDYDIGNAFG